MLPADKPPVPVMDSPVGALKARVPVELILPGLVTDALFTVKLPEVSPAVQVRQACTATAAPLKVTLPVAPAAEVSSVTGAPANVCEPVNSIFPEEEAVAVSIIESVAAMVPPPDIASDGDDMLTRPCVAIRAPVLVTAAALPDTAVKLNVAPAPIFRDCPENASAEPAPLPLSVTAAGTDTVPPAADSVTGPVKF